jgi:transposase
MCIGLDTHKNSCVVTQMDERGKVVGKEKIGTDKEEIERFFSSIERGKIVMESTGVWKYFYEILDSSGFYVTLSNPLKTRAIAETEIKTDKVDSEILAHLLRANLIPSVWIGNKEMRELRRVVNERMFLKRQSAQLKNRIRSELLRRGIKPEMDIFTEKGKEYLLSLDMSPINKLLSLLDATEEQIKGLNKELLEYYEDNEDARLLATIPGIGYYTALSLVAVIGDVNRFRDAEALCSYFGLVPSTHQSSDVEYHGSITKQGSSMIRCLLIQCAWVHIKCCKESSLTHFYSRLSRMKGKSKAIVATARKMVKVIYWMLKDEEPYHVEGHAPDIQHVHQVRCFG